MWVRRGNKKCKSDNLVFLLEEGINKGKINAFNIGGTLNWVNQCLWRQMLQNCNWKNVNWKTGRNSFKAGRRSPTPPLMPSAVGVVNACAWLPVLVHQCVPAQHLPTSPGSSRPGVFSLPLDSHCLNNRPEVLGKQCLQRISSTRNWWQ